MAYPTQDATDRLMQRGDFAETSWTLVLAAGKSPSTDTGRALETLCRLYRPPVYHYVRRCGHSRHDAEDLTQEFFARILKDNTFARANREKGRFRNYLLASLKHFLADEWDKLRAKKRGGGVRPLSLDVDVAEQGYLQVAASDLTPEKCFDRQWGLVLLEQGLKRLRQEFAADGKVRQFDRLKHFITNEGDQAAYKSVAKELGLNAKSLPVTVHRIRKRFKAAVRAELAQTVASPADLEEELRALFF